MASLVIGGSGTMGRRLVAALARSGEEVVATHRRPAAPPALEGVTWRRLALEKFSHWDEFLRGIDTVYHLAWSTIPSSAALDPAGDVAQNLVGTIRLLEAARKRAGIRVVFASTGGAIYGPARTLPIGEDQPAEPLSLYGLSKLTAERYIQNYQVNHALDAIALRIGNCYGPAQSTEKGLGAVTLFARAALRHEPITIYGSGEVVRDYVHVDDVVAALRAVGARRRTRGPVNIGCGVGHSLNDIVRTLRDVTGLPVEVQYAAHRPFDVAASVLDIQKARAQFDWGPTIDLARGIADVVAELRSEMSARCASPSTSTATSPSTFSVPKPMPAVSPASFRRSDTRSSSLPRPSPASRGKTR